MSEPLHRSTTLYGSVTLFWNGGTRDLDDFRIELAATLYYGCDNHPADLVVDYNLDLNTGTEPLDDPPFDGDSQNRACAQSPLQVATGTWLIGEAPDTGMVPHIAKPGNGFFSRLILANTSPLPQPYTLYPYAGDGSLLPRMTGILDGGQTLFSSMEEVFGTDDLSHFRFLGEDTLKVTAVYQADREGAGPAHLGARSETATLWRLYPGNTELTWDGIAVVNRGGLTTEVQVTQRNAAGEIIAEKVVAAALEPETKSLAVLSTLFEEITGSYFEVRASQPLVVIGLRGDPASNFLWENPAIPMP